LRLFLGGFKRAAHVFSRLFSFHGPAEQDARSFLHAHAKRLAFLLRRAAAFHAPRQ
jgi:hypothetical protein